MKGVKQMGPTSPIEKATAEFDKAVREASW